MHRPNQTVRLPIGAFLLLPLSCGLWCPAPVLCQTNGGGGLEVRGFGAEIDVTIHDSSGHVIVAPATVKLYKDGAPNDQGSTNKGRLFFMVHHLGEYTVIVEAAGYKSAQKDVTVPTESKIEVDIGLQKDTPANFTAGEAGDPILAPKAKEALDKALQALKEGKLEVAQKELDQALNLAPSNPELLYVQGVLDLKRRDWPRAQSDLEKALQMEPNRGRTLAALGMALCNQKKYEEAIAPLEQAVQLEPTSDWETYYALGESYYRRQRYPEALKASQQAQREANGQAPQVELLVAEALTAAGRYEDSAQTLRELIKQHPAAPEATTAKRFLDRLTADGKIKRQS